MDNAPWQRQPAVELKIWELPANSLDRNSSGEWYPKGWSTKMKHMEYTSESILYWSKRIRSSIPPLATISPDECLSRMVEVLLTMTDVFTDTETSMVPSKLGIIYVFSDVMLQLLGGSNPQSKRVGNEWIARGFDLFLIPIFEYIYSLCKDLGCNRVMDVITVLPSATVTRRNWNQLGNTGNPPPPEGCPEILWKCHLSDGPVSRFDLEQIRFLIQSIISTMRIWSGKYFTRADVKKLHTLLEIKDNTYKAFLNQELAVVDAISDDIKSTIDQCHYVSHAVQLLKFIHNAPSVTIPEHWKVSPETQSKWSKSGLTSSSSFKMIRDILFSTFDIDISTMKYEDFSKEMIRADSLSPQKTKVLLAALDEVRAIMSEEFVLLSLAMSHLDVSLHLNGELSEKDHTT